MTTSVHDEIRAMDEIRKQLESLDEDARRRVLDWVNDRFGERGDHETS